MNQKLLLFVQFFVNFFSLQISIKTNLFDLFTYIVYISESIVVIVDNSFDWLRFRHQIPPFRYVPLRLIFLCTYKIELLPFEWYTNGGDAVPWNVFIESKLYLKINELDELSFHLNN